LVYAAVVKLFKKKNRENLAPESIIIWASAAVTFLIFSLSKFQLPHYILIIFPQFSIITALFLQKLEGKTLKIFITIQNVVLIIMLILLLAIWFFFGFEQTYVVLFLILACGAFTFACIKGEAVKTLIGRSAMISITLALFLFIFFYPAILKYQSGMQAGNWLKENYPTAKPAVLNYIDAFSFDFYAPGAVKYFYSCADLNKNKAVKDLVIYVPEAELSNLKREYNTEILKTFEYFHITKLTGKFLNAGTRQKVLERFYLVKVH